MGARGFDSHPRDRNFHPECREGHDCKYAPWTDWSGFTEAYGGDQKYGHREIFFVPNGKDKGGEPCSPKDTQECPESCYTAGGSCPCIEKKKMTIIAMPLAR